MEPDPHETSLLTVIIPAGAPSTENTPVDPEVLERIRAVQLAAVERALNDER